MTFDPEVPQPLYHFKFQTIEDRNRAMDEYYPKRECSDIPGEYILPNGNVLCVFLEEVWEYASNA